MYDSLYHLLDAATRIVIIQPENPDGDSLASALALEALFSDQQKDVTLYCVIEMPKYLRYVPGWDRVEQDWTGSYDLALIVDTAAEALLQKTLAIPEVRHCLESNPVVVLDHHIEAETGNDLHFTHTLVSNERAASTGQLIFDIATHAKWQLSKEVSELLYISLQADTLGMTTQSVSVESFEMATQLVRNGVVPADVEQRRRQLMRKPADILSYKGELLKRIEYYVDGRLAIVHIPWDDIQQYSDRYNPSVLVLDEMRLVEGVDAAIAIKTYPDGKLTGKIRSNTPIAQQLAGYFGGGGHAYSAGFKIYESYEEGIREIIQAFATLKS